MNPVAPGRESNSALLPERTLEDLYRQSVEALPPILRGLGRKKRVAPEEVEDLRSHLHVKLLEGNYRVLRRWDHRSSLEVYLTTVVYNIWHDRVRGERGRFRVSAAARRLGPPAPELEVLIGRQELTFDEAYQTIKPRFPSLSRGEAEEIVAQINPRGGRDFESEGVVDWLQDLELTGDEFLEQREELLKKRKALALMQRRLAELPEQDRILLVLAHAEGVKFSRIARILGIDQRSLYRRNERLLMKLRTNLEEAGIRWEDLSEVLGIDGIEPPPRRRAFRLRLSLYPVDEWTGFNVRVGIDSHENVRATLDLAVFLEGRLTGEERGRMVRHLNHCQDCFERYTGAARLLDAIEEDNASALSAADGNRAIDPSRPRGLEILKKRCRKLLLMLRR